MTGTEQFPAVRMRRLRELQLIKETRLSVKDLIMPLFLDEHLEGLQKKPIASMPGQYRCSLESAINEIRDARSLGIRAVLLFGIPMKK